MLCAGIIRGRHTLTSEGIETNFAVNYLSRFALTEALRSNLAAGGAAGDAARILVISGAAQDGETLYEDVNLTGRFSILRAVSQFCEANDVFVLELARQMTAAVSPPFIAANVPLLSQTPQQIAVSARRLLLGLKFEDVSGGMFRHIKRFKELQAGPRASDPAQGQRLWNLSRQLVAQARASSAPDPA